MKCEGLADDQMLFYYLSVNRSSANNCTSVLKVKELKFRKCRMSCKLPTDLK